MTEILTLNPVKMEPTLAQSSAATTATVTVSSMQQQQTVTAQQAAQAQAQQQAQQAAAVAAAQQQQQQLTVQAQQQPQIKMVSIEELYGPTGSLWFNGCEYQCQLCKSNVFPSSMHLLNHVVLEHGLRMCEYASFGAELATKASAFRCELCGANDIRRCYEEIYCHFKIHHGGISFMDYDKIVNQRYNEQNRQEDIKTEIAAAAAAAANHHQQPQTIEFIVPTDAAELDHRGIAAGENKIIILQAAHPGGQPTAVVTSATVNGQQQSIPVETVITDAVDYSTTSTIGAAATTNGGSTASTLSANQLIETAARRAAASGSTQKPPKNEQKWGCPECGKTFSESSRLSRHFTLLHSHPHERPYKCNHCGKTFKQKHNLACHEMTHSGQRPFKCRFCSKAFTRKDHKENHERAIHTGEKPFVCEVCKTGFPSAGTLYNHTVKSHVKPAQQQALAQQQQAQAAQQAAAQVVSVEPAQQQIVIQTTKT